MRSAARRGLSTTVRRIEEIGVQEEWTVGEVLKRKKPCKVLNVFGESLCRRIGVQDLLRRPSRWDEKRKVAFVLHDPRDDSAVHVEPPSLEERVETILRSQSFLQDRDAMVSGIQQEYDLLKRERDDLEHRRLELENIVNKRLWRRGVAVGTYLTVQYSVLGYGVYEFSWDVMEPIAYFLGFTTTTWGALYFSRNKVENKYSTLWQRLQAHQRSKVYAEQGFVKDSKRLQLLNTSLLPRLETSLTQYRHIRS